MKDREQLLIDSLIDSRSHIMGTLSDIFRRDSARGMFFVNHEVINDILSEPSPAMTVEPTP